MRLFRRSPWLPVPALLLAGCGYIGDPIPPLANVPRPVSGLEAVQRGSVVVVQFRLPEWTTEDVALKLPPTPEVRISGALASPFDPAVWEGQAQPVPRPASSDGAVRYELPVQPWVDKPVTLGARAVGANGKASDWSFTTFRIVAPPPTPANVRGDGTPAGVRITWTGPPGQFRVLRRAGSEKTFTLIAVASGFEWVDSLAEFGNPYTYLVQRIVGVGENRFAESELPGEISITPRDTFPPSAPASLRAAASPSSIELSWDRAPDPDLAAYRVYRASPGAEFARIAEAGATPGYSDRTAQPGAAYRYAVTAVDRAGNESPRSPVAEASRP